MKYQKAKMENGEIIITETKEIDQSALTSDCWLIQFDRLNACKTCEYLNTSECGGKNIRKKLLKEEYYNKKYKKKYKNIPDKIEIFSVNDLW